jgi:hypothetical protein
MKSAKQTVAAAARRSIGLCESRMAGMKLRAGTSRAATGSFPYPHRTCAEWEELPNGKFADREMTEEERETDAVEGSARLRDAILGLAA